MATDSQVNKLALKDILDARYKTRAIAVLQRATRQKLEGKASMKVSTWPRRSLMAMPSGTVSSTIASALKVDGGDVEAAVTAAVESAIKTSGDCMNRMYPEDA